MSGEATAAIVSADIMRICHTPKRFICFLLSSYDALWFRQVLFMTARRKSIRGKPEYTNALAACLSGKRFKI